jgi:hypothetical protein
MSHLYSKLIALSTGGTDAMTADELRELGDQLSETAENHAHDMSAVVEGIASLLVIAGSDAGDRFRLPADLPALLGVIGCQFDLLAALAHISSEAQWKAAELDRQASKGGDHE